MILSDREIGSALDHRFIIINPRPKAEQIQSTAIDLTLDQTFLRWKEKIDPPPTGAGNDFVRPHADGFNIRAMMKDQRCARAETIDVTAGLRLERGAFILAYTSEKILLPTSSRLAARVEGKSSLARLGMGVHVTAPTIHAGFGYNSEQPEDAQTGAPIQLEIYHLGPFPIILDVGMAICQLILEEVREVPDRGYRGRFGTQEHFSVAASDPPGQK